MSQPRGEKRRQGGHSASARGGSDGNWGAALAPEQGQPPPEVRGSTRERPAGRRRQWVCVEARPGRSQWGASGAAPTDGHAPTLEPVDGSPDRALPAGVTRCVS